MHAVNDVTLNVAEGETVGLVGESGCGKTTLSRAIMRLVDPTDGRISFRGNDITAAGRRELEPLRREMQMVFQDPFASLNPRKRIVQIIGQPLRLHGTGRDQVEGRVKELLGLVGLHPEHLNRFPHEFSGGQRQRIGVARALALEPRLIVLDEPVSALDVSIQAQIINLLDDLQDEFRLTYLFVAHDLSVVRHVSDRIAVMYLGKLMEVSPAEELYTKPIHPYTSALLAAIPIPDPEENRRRERIVVSGEPPNPIEPPVGLRLPSTLPARHRHLPRRWSRRSPAIRAGTWRLAITHSACQPRRSRPRSRTSRARSTAATSCPRAPGATASRHALTRRRRLCADSSRKPGGRPSLSSLAGPFARFHARNRVTKSDFRERVAIPQSFRTQSCAKRSDKQSRGDSSNALPQIATR